MGDDWRAALLAEAAAVDVPALRRDPSGWPGYHSAPAVSVYRLAGDVLGRPVVAALWDFGVHGGSFGEDDATALAEAVRVAIAARQPLLTLVRSGGTRLQEGMAALVGIPRARLCLQALAAAQLAHLSVADAPTTGGVWISVTSRADLRVGVAGATVGFAGPRVVAAVTGELPGEDSHTAGSAYGAGLIDAVLPAGEVVGWLRTALLALHPDPAPARGAVALQAVERAGSEQVAAARGPRPDGAQLLARLGTAVPLRAPHGDTSVAAALGRLEGRPVVGVATAARRGGRPSPDGYRLLTRAAQLADRLGVPLLSLVDTPGAEPGPAAERDGVAGAIADALDAVIACRSPVVAFIHGEGGSGGALAAATADLLLVSPDSYFAAIGPEGAAAALRLPADLCADRLRLTPPDLLALGVADAAADWSHLAGHLDALCSRPQEERLAARRTRWAGPLAPRPDTPAT